MARPFLQHIRDSAAPRLDFVDFVACETIVSLDVVALLARVPAFAAAISGYRALLPLGYCGLFCRPAIQHLVGQLGDESLLDYLRVAAYCSELPAADPRHITLDTRSAKQRYPALFRFHDVSSGPQRFGGASWRLAEMGSFAPRHEFRAAAFPAVKQHDEDEYAAYLDRPA